MDTVAQREALHRLKTVTKPVLDRLIRAHCGGSKEGVCTHFLIITAAITDAIEAGMPRDVAVDAVFGRENLAHMVRQLAVEIKRLRAEEQAAQDIEWPWERELWEVPGSDSTASALEPEPRAGRARQHGPLGGLSLEMVRRLSDADAVAKAIVVLTEENARVAAEAHRQVRLYVGRTAARAAHLKPAARILRRPRASRSPRRAAHQTAAAATRDGPPPGSDPPAPVEALGAERRRKHDAHGIARRQHRGVHRGLRVEVMRLHAPTGDGRIVTALAPGGAR